jgi:hypothetical protein
MPKPEVLYVATQGLPIVGKPLLVLPLAHPSDLVTGDGKTWAKTSPVVGFEFSLLGLIIETENTVYIPGGSA